MNAIPPGARLLALNDTDMAYTLDGIFRFVVSGLEVATVPPGRTTDDTLAILERLRTLIDAAGDAIASKHNLGRYA